MITNNPARFIGGIILAFIVALYGISGLTDVDPGETGILIKKLGSDQGMQDRTLDTGLHWVEPFQYDVAIYDVRLKQYQVQALPAQSRDGQPMLVDVSLEIGLTDSKVPFLHENIGKVWYDQVVYPRLRTVLRNETAVYPSDLIYTSEGRTGIQKAAEQEMKIHLEPYGIRVSLNLRDLAFTNKDFINTIEQKAKEAQNVVIAERQAEREEWNAIKVANTAEGAKQKAIKEAEAERERLRLQGEGQRLQQEEIAKGILAVKQAEAEGARLQVNAYGDGSTYASVVWAEQLGPNVKVLGYPLGAPGTTGLFNVDGILGNALKLKQ